MNNRDLTMPGETGWAGFADAGRRAAARSRTFSALRPPARRWSDMCALQQITNIKSGG